MGPFAAFLPQCSKAAIHSSSIRSAAIDASCGIDTLLPAFAGTGRLRRSRIRALPFFYFSSSYSLRVMSASRTLLHRCISRIYTSMNKPIQTRTFKSGNSVAVRLPKGFAIPADTAVELDKSGDTVTIRLTRDEAEARRRMLEALDALKALPKPPRIQEREPLEFPDRPGL